MMLKHRLSITVAIKQEDMKMSRQSVDIVSSDGTIKDGYDYNLQVWVVGGLVTDCGHPEQMKKTGCCNSHRFAGQKISSIPEHEVRS